MPKYRLYFMHPTKAEIERFEDFEAPSDEFALMHAMDHMGKNPLELWSEGRKMNMIAALPDGDS
jgi:hypothetical protein